MLINNLNKNNKFHTTDKVNINTTLTLAHTEFINIFSHPYGFTFHSDSTIINRQSAPMQEKKKKNKQ